MRRIWTRAPCRVGSQEGKNALDNVKEIMTTLQGEPSVSIRITFDIFYIDFHEIKYFL